MEPLKLVITGVPPIDPHHPAGNLPTHKYSIFDNFPYNLFVFEHFLLMQDLLELDLHAGSYSVGLGFRFAR